MGRAILPVAPELLVNLLSKGTGFCEADSAPAEMKILGARWVAERQHVEFEVESPDLPEFPAGHRVPHLTIHFRDRRPGYAQMLDLGGKLLKLAGVMWPEGECSSPTEKGASCPDD